MNMLERIRSKYWGYRLLVKCRRDRERERQRERLNIANKIKHLYYSFSITKLQKLKKK